MKIIKELEHQGWEEKFDEEFDVFYNDSSWAGKKQVKYYIYVLLENQKREIIEIIEKVKKEYDYYHGTKALDEVLNKLKKD